MALVTNEKQSFEEVDLTFDFFNRGIADGVSIANVTSITAALVSGTGSLVVSGTTYSGLLVSARFAGGLGGDKFKLTAKVVMSDGQKYECDGYLKVKEL